MLNESSAGSGPGESHSNVVRLPTWREKRRQRERDDWLSKVQLEAPKLRSEDWVLALAVASAISWAIYTIIVT